MGKQKEKRKNDTSGSKKRKVVDASNDQPSTSTDHENDDMDQDSLKSAMETYLEEEFRKQEYDKDIIHKETILQRDSSKWHEMRKKMVTSANFGRIIKRKKSSGCAKLVGHIRNDKNISHLRAVAHGIKNQQLAREQLSKQENVKIDPCGLFIDSKYPFIGASPNGIIGDDKLVEIYCPYAAFKKNIELAIKDNQIELYKYNKKEDTYTINRNSSKFYQVQGHLHVTQRKECLYAIWTGKKRKLKVDRIEKDDKFWKEKMEEPLVTFYMECLLPELVDSRQNRGKPIRNTAVKSDLKMKWLDKGPE